MYEIHTMHASNSRRATAETWEGALDCLAQMCATFDCDVEITDENGRAAYLKVEPL